MYLDTRSRSKAINRPSKHWTRPVSRRASFTLLGYNRAARRVICTGVLVVSFLTWINPTPIIAHIADEPPTSLPAGCVQVTLAGVINGSWDILIFDTQQQRVLNLTDSPDDEHAPSWSPNGQMLAFTARRMNNWDVYLFDLRTSTLRRLTNSSGYDGAPAWSPDSSQIAFESNRDDNLNIYIARVNDGAVTRVTDAEDADIEPLWTVDGKGLIFGSWRDGTRQLYHTDLTTHITRLLTQADHGAEARQPALSPDGSQLAFTSTGDTGVRLVLRNMHTGSMSSASTDQHREWPTWSPDNSLTPSWLVALELSASEAYYESAKWAFTKVSARSELNASQAPLLQPVLSLQGQWRHPSCAPAGALRMPGPWVPMRDLVQGQGDNHRQGLAPLPGVRARQPRLAAAVTNSFVHLRQRTLEASGHDFLDTLNDVWRHLDHPGGAYLSWHKTGRAFDVRDWYAPGGRQSLYIARQDVGEHTYFRIYLRAAKQDGSQGMPLRESIWQTDGRLARPDWTKAGGRPLPPPNGYFVDFTDLAEREGWMRIPALTPPDGDWRRTYLDLEFWHYERRDGLRWYQAMQRLYDATDLEVRYSASRVSRHGYTIDDLRNAGIPNLVSEDRSAAVCNHRIRRITVVVPSSIC
jgi:TolB protein